MQRLLPLAAALALALCPGCDRGVEAKPRYAALGVPKNPDAPEAWKPYYEALSALGDGFVTWESRRKGKWRIWMRPLDGSAETQLSPDEPGRDHVAAHISPDGRHVVYLSLPAPHDDFDPRPRGRRPHPRPERAHVPAEPRGALGQRARAHLPRA
jgi:hypothetical protein